MMIAFGDIHACTDITGFGLLGHACEMIEGETVGLRINSAAMPVFDGVHELIKTGLIPGGLYRNREFRISQVVKEKTCPDWLFDLLFDPQTAGGLFFSLPANKTQKLVETMQAAGIIHATVVGDVVKEHPSKILVY
jgi:selenide,water dikinase